MNKDECQCAPLCTIDGNGQSTGEGSSGTDTDAPGLLSDNLPAIPVLASGLVEAFDVAARWIIDSGAGQDLVPESRAKRCSAVIVDAMTITFRTANVPLPSMKDVPLADRK